ncbi:hypothetical protein EV368DRAFT_62677 [Lentinula lateritia]|nr:hypothetical protein EV368DRAFT_62677 [Lentinula lateritia]
MRVSSVFVCLFFGLVSTVCAAPLPIHVVSQLRRSDPARVTVNFVDNSQGSLVSMQSTDFLAVAQSLLDQHGTGLGIGSDFVILAENVPTKQQSNLLFTFEGGSKCMPTLPCNVAFGTGSGDGGPISATVSIRENTIFTGDVTVEDYNAAKFVFFRFYVLNGWSYTGLTDPKVSNRYARAEPRCCAVNPVKAQ